ncbi:hypothetical protein EC957_009833 [Mortierella hygrophila]|uniref:Uncharacterized protein n=1 Tax=Mortierella hygrophila TaxID=979708 RepID=A0A9P6FBJ6_9FUNG|nr:hypothetical protein EC957_009833 [Mortierella hygrophila]
MVSQSIIRAVVQIDEAAGKFLEYRLIVLQFLECNRVVLEVEVATVCCHLIDRHRGEEYDIISARDQDLLEDLLIFIFILERRLDREIKVAMLEDGLKTPSRTRRMLPHWLP